MTREETVRVVTITQLPDGSFAVRGTIGRDEVPVVLRMVADQIEDTNEGDAP